MIHKISKTRSLASNDAVLAFNNMYKLSSETVRTKRENFVHKPKLFYR